MTMLKFFCVPFLFVICLALSISFQSCDDDDCDDDGCDTCVIVYKPNIYIYPETEIQLNVSLEFPQGGNVIASIPEYGTGWNVSVDTTGLIDGEYQYLFYESTQPDIWQRNYGWSIKKENLETFFRGNMTDYGFAGQEIDDFIDYWIPKFNDYSCYAIFPQTKVIIDDVIQLNFSIQPDNFLRLFYVVEGKNRFQDNLQEPNIDYFCREDYFVVEWGVVLD